MRQLAGEAKHPGSTVQQDFAPNLRNFGCSGVQVIVELFEVFRVHGAPKSNLPLDLEDVRPSGQVYRTPANPDFLAKFVAFKKPHGNQQIARRDSDVRFRIINVVPSQQLRCGRGYCRITGGGRRSVARSELGIQSLAWMRRTASL